MSVDKYKEWILLTIDQLRSRKARPDITRICHMVQRKYGLNSIETKALVEKLVDAEIVIKVDYKGNTSYRNAAKARKIHLGGQVLNSFAASKMLVDAVRALTQGMGGDGALKGASIRDIERWLVSQNLDRDELKCPLHVMLQREVDAGHLEKLANGNYIISPHGSKAGKMKAMMLKRCLSNPSKRGRPPKKKKMKRFYSYEPEPSATATSPPLVVKIPAPVCDFCQHSTNRSGEAEELLFCKDCNAKAHPTCMEYSAVLAHRARMYPWQCMDCKTCNLCKDAGDADSMLFCDACDKGYHMNCHKPQITEKPSGKWICFECSQQGIKTSDIEPNTTEDANGFIPFSNATNGTVYSPSVMPITPCDSPVQELEQSVKRSSSSSISSVPSPLVPKFTLSSLEGARYPDASKWSIEDVGTFFESIGFMEQADAFREQEIDGQSLLLMKRSDVLTGLSIRLGPALKIYQHVIKLQTAGLENSLFY